MHATDTPQAVAKNSQPPIQPILNTSLRFYLVTGDTQRSMMRISNLCGDAVSIWDEPNGDCVFEINLYSRPDSSQTLRNILDDLDELAQNAIRPAKLSLGVETPWGWQVLGVTIGPGYELVSPWLYQTLRLQ